MSNITITGLKNRADQVKSAGTGENTKTRIGGLFYDTADKMNDFYEKSQTYSKEEVNSLVGIPFVSVTTLPTASASTVGKIYLVPKQGSSDTKEMYVTVESNGTYSWEKIGSTDVDLTDYLKKSDVLNALTDGNNNPVKSDALFDEFTKLGTDVHLMSRVNATTVSKETMTVSDNYRAGDIFVVYDDAQYNNSTFTRDRAYYVAKSDGANTGANASLENTTLFDVTFSGAQAALYSADYKIAAGGGGGSGTVTGAKVGSGSVINPDSNGVINLPNYETNADVTTAAKVKAALGTGSGSSKFLREDGTWQVPSQYSGGITEMPGVNILSSCEDGKGIVADGTINSNTQWAGRWAVTEKLYFNGHDSITCSGCAPGRGFYYAVYDNTDHKVSGGAQTSTIVTAEKGSTGVYARFTVETFDNPTQIYGETIQAQYGDTITEYEPYSAVGGYLPQKVFFCGPNREIKTFKEGVEKATSVTDGVLYVDPGEYDLIQEFGSAYFDSIVSTTSMAGLTLRNRVHIICSSNTKITCHYTGSNANVMKLFSPLNAGEYGFTIENMNIEASRTRYLIHDERNGGTEQCQHKYLNCRFKFDNHENTAWSNEAIIGGGLGCASEVDIRNCVFECYGSDSMAISYHQNNNYSQHPEFRSTINVEGNYIVRGRIVFAFDQESTGDDLTIIQIKNNSVPYKAGQQDGGLWTKSGSAWTKNVAYVWNNEVRQ